MGSNEVRDWLFHQMPRTQAEALWLTYWEGYTEAEAAAVLSMPMEDVRQLIRGACDHLRFGERLDPLGPSPEDAGAYRDGLHRVGYMPFAQDWESATERAAIRRAWQPVL